MDKIFCKEPVVRAEGDILIGTFPTSADKEQYITFHCDFSDGIRWEEISLDFDLSGEYYRVINGLSYYTTTKAKLYLSKDAATWDLAGFTNLGTSSTYHQKALIRSSGTIYNLYIKIRITSDQYLDGKHVTVKLSNFTIGGKKCQFRYP